ncbi:TPA: ead/Ea22-like family protein [Pseudomonas aeruginosa]
MDTNKLKELAERATPGPWSCNRHWAIVGGPTLEFTNGAAQQQIAMACWQSWMHEEELRNNAEFIAAANPKTVLGLIDEVERLEEELSQCASALPGTYYMDPPDGGNVSIPEQIRRMAKDAARYRWLRDLPEDSPHEQIGNFPGWMWDEAIDKGMAEIQVTQPGATSSP